MTTMPLEGIRVLDWTIWQQGPVATAMLADLGADVIKIEERVGGDPGRGILRMSGVDISDRPNFYFEANNRNKKSMTLDLKQPDATEIVHRLVRRPIHRDRPQHPAPSRLRRVPVRASARYLGGK